LVFAFSFFSLFFCSGFVWLYSRYNSFSAPVDIQYRIVSCVWDSTVVAAVCGRLWLWEDYF